MTRMLGLSVAIALAASVHAADLSGISNAEATSGLKQALTDGSAAAVAQLGVQNGFFSNPKVKIPLPPALQRIEGRALVSPACASRRTTSCSQ